MVKKQKIIRILHPRVTPVSKRGDKYVYRVGRFKGCYVLTGHDKETGKFVFKQTKCKRKSR